MIVSAAKLKKFITKCIVYSRGMSGKRAPYFLDLKLSAENNTLFCSGISKEKNIMIDFNIPVECNESETFYVSDAVDFLRVLKDGIKGKIEITHQGISTDVGLIEYPLKQAHIDTVSNYPVYYNKILGDNDKLGYGNAGLFNTTIIAKGKDIADAVKKVNYRYELFEYRFEVMDNRFFVSILSRDGKDFETEIPAIIEGDDCGGIYSIGVDCIFKELGQEVTLHLNSNTPMIVEDDTGDRVVFFPVEYLDGDDK